MNPNQLRTLFEGSARLNVSYWMLYRAGVKGLIKTVRLSGRVMIPESELAHIEEYGFGPGKRQRKRKANPEAQAAR